MLLDNTSATTGTATSNDNRLNNAAGLTLSGGNFIYLGASNAASSQTLASLTTGTAAVGGNAVVGIVGGGTTGTAALNFTGTFSRTAGALITFETVNPLTYVSGATPTQQLVAPASFTGSVKVDSIIFGTALTGVGTGSAELVAGATVFDATSYAGVNTTNFNFATSSNSFAASGSVVALPSAGYTTTFSGTAGNAGTDLIVSAADTYTTTTTDTPNAILFIGGGALRSTVGTTVTVGSNMIAAASGSNTFGGGTATLTWALGANEGLLATNDGASLTFAATGTAITSSGANFLTMGGGTPTSTGGAGGTVAVNINPTTAATTVTFLDSGTFSIGSASALGATAATDTLTAAGGTITSAALTVANAIKLVGPVTANIQNALTLSGIISGSGSLTMSTGTSTLTTGGVNTFTGGITVNAGTLADNATANNVVLAGALVINSAGSFTDGLNGGTPLGSATAFIMNGATMNWGANGTDLTSAAGNVILNGGTLTESGAGPSEVTTQNNNVVVLSNTTFDAPLQGTAAKTAFFNVAAGVTFTQSGLLFGNNTGNVVKIGPGILSLQGATADAGTGDMVVNEGVLQLNKTAAPARHPRW